jgi:hypothetical protein
MSSSFPCQTNSENSTGTPEKPSEFDFGLCRCQGEALFCQAAFSPHGKAAVISVNITLTVSRLIHRASRSRQQGLAPPPTALNCIARRRGKSKVAFKYKKGGCFNRLISLDRKRQFLTVNRHDQSVYRQKNLRFCRLSAMLLTV